MVGVIKRLESGETAKASNRRKSVRAAAKAEARLASSSGGKARGTIVDVSTHGCNISADSDWLRPGGIITVSLKSGAGLQGIVRWVRDGNAGIEFLRPIPADADEWHALADSFLNS